MNGAGDKMVVAALGLAPNNGISFSTDMVSSSAAILSF